jgi:hypothetical protein
MQHMFTHGIHYGFTVLVLHDILYMTEIIPLFLNIKFIVKYDGLVFHVGELGSSVSIVSRYDWTTGD